MKVVKLECVLLDNKEIIFCGRSLGFVTDEEIENNIEVKPAKTIEMKVPKNFKIFGDTIRVIFDNENMGKESTIGISEHSKSLITLASEYKGESLSDDMIIDSFYHEKVHMILDSMYEHKLSSNERFVEVFSRLLRQSEKTKEY